jgi:hypothetical protein
MEEDELRAAAEAIRSDLPDLIGDAAERDEVAVSLSQALGLPAGTAHSALRAALGSHPAVREWMRHKTRVTEQVSRIIGPLGRGTGTVGVLFVCPELDYSIVRETVSDETLLCPNDGSVLQRQGG